MKGLKFEDLL